MTSLIGHQTSCRLGLAAALIIALAHPVVEPRAGAALDSGVYETLPGATVEERGDRVPGGIRVVPLAATLTFELAGAQPSLTAVIHNAVLEGGEPFALTVRSATGSRLTDGAYRFTGDYLAEVNRSGSQYRFDWKFTPSAERLVWDGVTSWAEGHLWQFTISDVTIVPEPNVLALLGTGLGLFWVLRATGQKIGNRPGAAAHPARGTD